MNNNITNVKNCFVFNDCNHKDCGLNTFCLRKYKLDSLYDSALLAESQKQRIALLVDADGTDLDKFQRLSEIEKQIVSFVDNGNSLYIYSQQTGNGKSSWALRFIQSYLNKIWPKSDLECRALFISVPKFLLAIKDNISMKNDYISYIKENILSADLVVWDDICNKNGSEYEVSHLLNFIENRIELNKSNVYTSNISPENVSTYLGERLASRITQLSECIELKGGDKRGLKRGENK